MGPGADGMKALVIGGGGFLGSRIARMLHERGDQVTVLGRRRYPQLEAVGITAVQGDLRDAGALGRACKGKDVVFHLAAKIGIWGKRRTFWEINVAGTENVIEACRANGVCKLVYTSTPSVVFGDQDLCGVDESQPYPSRYLAAYPETKAAAERMILAANSPSLATVALRPHLIWGPGDPHLVPRLLDRARNGRLIRISNTDNLADITYIDNASDGHIRAADALAPGTRCAGRAYFINQGEPVSLWSWIAELLERLGVPHVRRSISFRTAYWAGAGFEALYRILQIENEPPMTRFLATQLARSHYFSICAARRDFGYEPQVSTEEGLRRLVEWYQRVERLRVDSASPSRCPPERDTFPTA